MAGENNGNGGAKGAAPTPAPTPAPPPAPQAAPGGAGGAASQPGPAADSNPATSALGALDATQADDFQRRQGKAAGRAPATTVGGSGTVAGLGAALPPDQQVVRERGKPGEQGKPLGASDTARYVFDGITVHAPGPDHIPFAFENNGAGAASIKDGHFQAHEYPPGTVVVLSRKEGDKLIDRHGGRRLADDENPPGQLPPNVTDHGPQGPGADQAQVDKEAQRQAEEGFAEGQAHQANG